MPLSWAPGLQRNQLIRRAAKILAIQRALQESTPDQWRIHKLAKMMLSAVAEQRGKSWSIDAVVLRQVTQRIRDLDAGTEKQEQGVILGRVEVHSKTPAIYPVVEDDGAWKADFSENLLEDPQFWTHPESHHFLRNIVSLDGMACESNLVGPWQSHEPRNNAVHRAAMAAQLCERAYLDEMQWNPPWMLRASTNLNPAGMMHTLLGLDTPEAEENSFENRFIIPWKARFEKELQEPKEMATPNGPLEWNFLKPDEVHWTLELCWAIVKESHKVRLDCPPHVVPLHFLKNRGQRTLEQALYQYLVDDPEGPRMKATNAAHMLDGDPHNVHELLRQARQHKQYSDHSEGEEPWDPLADRHHRMMPMAFRESDSARNAPTGAPNPGPAKVGNGGENHSQE